ncbi:competence protein ComEC [Naumannella cuiyingiana]|uniref:Competence protein ComEC n=1 Tax=Naumannella cuiyingiana TaxID=1347891 RepID=A0A7Z0IK23_9ACTN|nr:competence protein ComEC [Naumannella cuiyingiana]
MTGLPGVARFARGGAELVRRRVGAAARREPPGARGGDEAAAAGDHRLVLPALAVWGGVLAIVQAGPVGALGAAVGAAVLIMVGVRLRRRAATAAGVLVVIICAAALLRVAATEASPARALARDEAGGRVVVVITSDARYFAAKGARPAFAVRYAQLRELRARGQTWRLDQTIALTGIGPVAEALRGPIVGTTLEARAGLRLPDPGERAVATARLRAPPVTIAPAGALDRRVEAVRVGLRASVAGHPEERRGLVPALVVGDVSGVPERLGEDFRTTALTHLTAVSGANLTLMLAFVLFVARWIGVRGWWLRVIGLGGVIGFVLLCRTEPSVLRAAAMGLVGLAGLGLTAGLRRGMRPLCAAVLGLLLVDPWLAAEIGFALSVFATGGIVWWAGGWADRLAGWLPRPLAEALAVPLAAQVATQPVVTAISGQVSIVGLLANALAGPLVGPATVAGFAAAALSQVHPWPAAAAGFVAAWCAQGIIAIGTAGAALPGAAMAWPADPLAVAVLGVGCLLWAAVLPAILARRLACLLLGIVLITIMLRGPVQPGWPPPGWRLVACDVGQGDGLAIRAGPAAAVVVDAGPEPEPIARCLDQLGITDVPLLILSHGHADHVGGLPGVLERRRMGTVLVSSASTGSAGAAALAGRAGATVVAAGAGQAYRVGEAEVEVLAPCAAPARARASPATGKDGESAAENDAGLLVRVRSGGVSVLLSGDLEPAGQAAALRCATDLRAAVLKVPHHGSSRQDERFLAATGARIAIASAGAGNDYGHPSPRTLGVLGALGMTVARTDTQGAAAVAVVDGRPRLFVQRRA